MIELIDKITAGQIDAPKHAYWDDAEFLFNGLKALSSDGNGITRPSYSAKETEALAFLAHYAKKNGLHVSQDEAQNYYFSLDEDQNDKPFILLGSHIDSVPQGGNYDGAAGIVAGLLCLVRAKKEAQAFHSPVKVVAIRGEESAWFGKCYLGSRAMLGQLDSEDLAATHRDTGQSLKSYMAAEGINVDKLERGEALIRPEQLISYLEIHIEQGPVLVETKRPLAIVSGIRGNIRHKEIICVGEAGHSGAVPREYRHDSVFAVSDLLMKLEDHWKMLLSHHADLVITSGIVSTNYKEHAMSRIPGKVSFSFEARSEHSEVLDMISSLLISESKIVERERNVKFEIDEALLSNPATLDAKIVESLKQAAVKTNCEPFVMASGAGHDAAVFANAGVPSGMIFIRNEHGSHNPQEAMDLHDLLLGVDVMWNYLNE